MSESGRVPRRKPAHARPSLLAPTRSVTVVGGLLAAAGLVVAGCAAVAAHASTEIRPGGRPSPVKPLAIANSTFFAGVPGPVSTAARIAVAASGGPAWYVTGGRPTAPRSGTRVIAPTPGDDAPSSALAASGIPITALIAYRQAAAREAKRQPRCGLTWPLLGGIGRIESNHGRFAGAVLHSDGLSTPPVIGIPLNGNGTALIRDTDGGQLDGDRVYDRAVGPMQFIPSTWAGFGVDANGDGVADPFNIFDAAAAAADYLCAAGRDLRTYAGQVVAVRSYNNSDSYISLVLGVEKVYAGGVGITVPVEPTGPDPGGGHPGGHHPHLPPVDPGHPPGLEHHPHPSCDDSGQADQSATPAPTRTYEPSGPTDPQSPQPCATDPGSSTPPPHGGGHHHSSSGSTTPPVSTTSAPPTSPVPSSSDPDPGSPTDTSSGPGDDPSSSSSSDTTDSSSPDPGPISQDVLVSSADASGLPSGGGS